MSDSTVFDLRSPLAQGEHCGCCDTARIPDAGSLLTRAIRPRLLACLERVRDGQIAFRDGPLAASYGTPGFGRLSANLIVCDQRFYPAIAWGGSVGFGEAYVRGEWTTDDLTSLLRVFIRNMDRLPPVDGWSSRLSQFATTLAHRIARNSTRSSRRNIARHYDLSNEFFSLFLDPTLMYSAALFEDTGMTLEQASVAKLDAVCRRLDLQPGDHVVEIGSGWGGFALHAARNYGCRVTTTTISEQQYELARRLIDAAGLFDRIRLLRDDYRELTGSYDKLVSIEMLEAVGHQYYDAYFGKCHRLLKRGGRMVVQTITMPEQRYAAYLRSADFIQKYIFPGGCLPSLAAIHQSVGRATDLRMIEQVDFGLSYARTLAKWRKRFRERLDSVRELGFDEQFIRMWNYYLCYCEAAFLERAVGVSQLVWVKA